MRKFLQQRKSFTLVETILVVALIAMISIAIFRSLTNGMKIWERSQRFVLEEDVAIFLDRFEREVRNAFNYSLFIFDGEEDRILFPTIVWTPVDKKISGQTLYVEQLGTVEYSFDKFRSSLNRQQANYSQTLAGKFGRTQSVVGPVSGVKFTYYVTEDNTIKEMASWKGRLPMAIRVDVDLLEQSGNKRTISQLINIPINWKI
jgi:type II secretory pathway component PulJ